MLLKRCFYNAVHPRQFKHQHLRIADSTNTREWRHISHDVIMSSSLIIIVAFIVNSCSSRRSRDTASACWIHSIPSTNRLFSNDTRVCLLIIFIYFKTSYTKYIIRRIKINKKILNKKLNQASYESRISAASASCKLVTLRVSIGITSSIAFLHYYCFLITSLRSAFINFVYYTDMQCSEKSIGFYSFIVMGLSPQEAPRVCNPWHVCLSVVYHTGFNQFICLFVTIKHTDASTQVQIMTTYEKH